LKLTTTIHTNTKDTMIEFRAFPKIARLNRAIIITEKLDGTNACVVVGEDGTVSAQSRSRVIVPGADNFGFASWVAAHADELRALGPGYHFGEWWGAGIQRGYGLKEKRFSLFNTHRWGAALDRPACCHVVPVLHTSVGFNEVVGIVESLRSNGSVAAPGFMNPEGIVAFHTASSTLFKVLLENDHAPKGV
jgi:hypothetical protein